MTNAIFYDRINQAIDGLTNQLNINASHDLQREQLGIQRLMSTQNMLMQLEQNQRAKEMQQATIANMKADNRRADAANLRAETVHNMSLPGLKLNMLKAKNAIDPTVVNIGKWFTDNPYLINELKTNTAFQKSMASIYGPDAKFDPTTANILDKDGKPLKLPGFQQADKVMQILGVAESYLDPTRGLQFNQDQLQSNLINLQKEYKNVNERDAGKRASLAAQIAQTKSSISKYDGQFNPLKLLESYKRKDNLLRLASSVVSSQGGDPSIVNLLSNAIANNSKLIGETQKEIFKMGAGSGEGKTQQRMAIKIDKDGNMIPNSMVLLNTPKNMPSAMIPKTVDPNLDGYVWSDDISLADKIKGKGGSDKLMSEEQALKYLDSFYGAWDNMGQYTVTKGLARARSNAQQYYKDMKLDKPDMDKQAIALESRNWSMHLENEYNNAHKLYNDFTEQDIAKKLRDMGKEVSKETIAATYVQMHKSVDDWYLNESYEKNLPKREITDFEKESEQIYKKYLKQLGR